MILKRFEDYLYPSREIIYKRETVRGVVYDNLFNVAILKIAKEDKRFGLRDHYELVGGGIDEGESLIEAAIRESKEESGAEVKDVVVYDSVENIYNLLQRLTINHIFSAKVISIGKTELEDYEKLLIVGLEWINIYKLEEILKKHPTTGVGKLIHERDLFILQYVMEKLGLQPRFKD